MFKVIALLKRRPGMSMEEFKTYYEDHHRLIGDKYLVGHAARYIRRYIISIGNPLSGETAETEYDVVTETWYADRASFEEAAAKLAAPAAMDEISRDEEKLFDRGKHRFFTVEEYESDLQITASG